eukprot:FR740208.1.p2 GENE.FR740208.1~~FR740208.1.p2  ORF type:complete len:127 (-),score=35.77 FR740208.1:372-752(-)
MTMITPSAQLTLTKGNKSWSSTAVAAALELVDPLGSGPWLSLTAAAFFFFFFFFFFSSFPTITTDVHKQTHHARSKFLYVRRVPSMVSMFLRDGSFKEPAFPDTSVNAPVNAHSPQCPKVCLTRLV